jgi:hypothetical protein
MSLPIPSIVATDSPEGILFQHHQTRTRRHFIPALPNTHRKAFYSSITKHAPEGIKK